MMIRKSQMGNRATHITRQMNEPYFNGMKSPQVGTGKAEHP